MLKVLQVFTSTKFAIGATLSLYTNIVGVLAFTLIFLKSHEKVLYTCCYYKLYLADVETGGCTRKNSLTLVGKST